MQESQSLVPLDKLDERVKFVEIMADPERMGLSVIEIAEMFHISRATVYNRGKDKEISKEIEERRAEMMKIELPKVDDAMLKAAQKGNVRAAILVYERWDGYNPKGKGVDITLNQAQQFNIKQANGEK